MNTHQIIIDTQFFFFSELLVFIYLLSEISYTVFFTSSHNKSYPTLLSSVSSFSFFVLLSALILFDAIDVNFSYNLFHGSFKVCYYSILFKTILLIATILLLFICKDFLVELNIFKFEYDIIIIFSITGLLLLNNCDDFLVLYLAIELQSLCFYVLATFQRNSDFSTEAGLKYFILGAFSSGLLLFGITLIYISFGSISLEKIYQLGYASKDLLAFFGYTFLLFAFFFKIGAFPFHMWLCDVYEGSLTTVTAFFSAVPKIIIFSLIIKLSFIDFKGYDEYSKLLFGFSGLASICFASIVALYQKRMKRLIAYSTISHTGFILLAICCGSIDSVKSCIIYISLYSLMTLSIFSILMITGIKKKPKYLVNWASFARQNIWFALVFSFVLFSIAGIPPLAGFYSKFCVLYSLLTEMYITTSIVVIIFSSIACFYYIRLIKIFFFTDGTKINFWFNGWSKNIEIFLSVSTCFLLFFLCLPAPLTNLCEIAAVTFI